MQRIRLCSRAADQKMLVQTSKVAPQDLTAENLLFIGRGIRLLIIIPEGGSCIATLVSLIVQGATAQMSPPLIQNANV
jgi:hypothetical protein